MSLVKLSASIVYNDLVAFPSKWFERFQALVEDVHPISVYERENFSPFKQVFEWLTRTKTKANYLYMHDISFVYEDVTFSIDSWHSQRDISFVTEHTWAV